MSLSWMFVYPLRGQGGVLLGIWTLALYLMLALFDISRPYSEWHALVTILIPIIWVITFGLFQHYAWACLRHVAEGRTEPTRSIDVVETSPFSNYLMMLVSLLLLGVAGLLAACFAVATALGVLVAIAVGVVLPGVLGVMIIDERFVAGLEPARVARFVADLGAPYAVFAFALYGAIAALYAACVTEPNVLTVALASYTFILGHVVAGRVLYSCRDRLDLSTLSELDPLKVDEEALSGKIDALMVELHRLCAVDRVERANGLLEGFLREHEYALDERIHQRLHTFQDQRLRLEHGWHYLNRLTGAGKTSRGWALLRQSLDIDPLFRPGGADTLMTLVAAAPAADAAYVDALLSDFERAYPDSERTPQALFEHARWLVTQLGSADRALKLLTKIEQAYPEWAAQPHFQSFRQRVRRHGAQGDAAP